MLASTSKRTVQARKLSLPNLVLPTSLGREFKRNVMLMAAPRVAIPPLLHIQFKAGKFLMSMCLLDLSERRTHLFHNQHGVSRKYVGDVTIDRTPDFIPLVLEKGLGLQDEMVEIPDGAGVAMSQSLARNEGILTGISGGATMWAAVETAKKAPEGSVLVAMLPDTGERYLSTPLFASIAADMNEEELEIARSTPSFILEPVAS